MAKNTRSAAVASVPGTPSEEAIAALLSVLQGVDRQVQTTLTLSPEAEAAVERFRDIAFDLATVATSGFSAGSAGATREGV